MRNSRKKFFGEAYFRERISARDFSLFQGGHFSEWIFSGKKFFRDAYFRGSLSGTGFSGKKIHGKLFALIREKTPGLPGGGGSGGGRGEYPGDMPRS